ncbi:hypothetical protein [Actinomadura rupiterrae]|uniref:aggregation-promoting factor C-terminal-like domain-containing protein n=1 Tax=Actinomadura rupiterrae TaxID=559627 RepID=UPI002646EE6F|nr:hypothetical protein [Actinomadura rupiterrae]MCP2336736.1 hypothetical protein [Actinomadura rupiterrae]
MSGDRSGSSWRDDRHNSDPLGQDGHGSPASPEFGSAAAPHAQPTGSEPFGAPGEFGADAPGAFGADAPGVFGADAPGAFGAEPHAAGPFGADPHAAEPFGAASDATQAHDDDVKVAGSARRPGEGGAGDTGELPPVASGFPGATEVISSDQPPAPRAPRRARGGRRPAPKSGPGRSGSSGGPFARTGVKIAAVAAGAAVVIGGGAAAAFALTGSDSGPAKKGPDKTTLAAGPNTAKPPAMDTAQLEALRKKQALDRASRAARGETDPTKLMPKGKPVPSPSKTADSSGGGGGDNGPSGDPVPAGEAQSIAKQLLPSFGFSGSGQFGCLVKLWNRESGWNTHASNPSGAYGIPQALPGSKMASAGSDWRNSASTQIKWGLGYIKDRYGTPCGAWAHSQSTGWY